MGAWAGAHPLPCNTMLNTSNVYHSIPFNTIQYNILQYHPECVPGLDPAPYSPSTSSPPVKPGSDPHWVLHTPQVKSCQSCHTKTWCLSWCNIASRSYTHALVTYCHVILQYKHWHDRHCCEGEWVWNSVCQSSNSETATLSRPPWFPCLNWVRMKFFVKCFLLQPFTDTYLNRERPPMQLGARCRAGWRRGHYTGFRPFTGGVSVPRPGLIGAPGAA